MKFFNSLTKSLEEFKPLSKNKVTIYVCGITPYDTTHLGHAFTYIAFDVLIRYLRFKGYKVTYTQNVTDVNDRDKDILHKAKEQNMPWSKLADFWTNRFLTDMKGLNWIFPEHFLKASEQIPFMITLIEKLLKNNLAYKVKNSVYLDVSKIKNYGKLSRLSLKDMLKVAKDFEEDLENPEKINPLDITLWKSNVINQPSHIPSFDSPFGKGRPGWHIECSAMSIKTLGEQIDIHGGGIDLIFPHHEAEIVQSEGATNKRPFAKYWLHAGTVLYEGEKMSKSKGNLVLVSDLLKKYSPNSIRWLLLSNNWNKPWEFKEDDLKKAQKEVEIVETAIRKISGVINNKYSPSEFSKIMDNNLDTKKALQLILKLIKNSLISEAKTIFSVLGFIIS